MLFVQITTLHCVVSALNGLYFLFLNALQQQIHHSLLKYTVGVRASRYLVDLYWEAARLQHREEQLLVVPQTIEENWP